MDQVTDNQVSFFEGGQVNLACFEVNERLVAIDVAHVCEIVRPLELTPLPKAPALIEGVIDLRNSVVPVLDLSRAMGGEPAAQTGRTRIVIIEIDGLVFGLRVAAAVDVLAVEAGALEDPPMLAVQAGYDAVRAIVRRTGAPPVMVLSLEHVLEQVYRSALPQRGEGS